MARKPEIEYVRYYTAGSAAKVLERRPVSPKPKVNRKHAPVKKIVIPFDSIAVIGTAVAVVMFVCMLVGFYQLTKVNSQIVKTENAISTMKAENTRLQEKYKQSYNLEAVKTAAVSMGLVPRDQVKHITIHLPEPVEEEQPSWWESFVESFKELFAY